MKKVLVLTYYFPPSGKASLHLPLAIIKHLPEFGVQPVVMTVSDEGFSAQDDAFGKLISPDLRVIKTKTWEPFSLYRKFTGKKKDEQLVASETISLENKSISHRISLWIRLNLFIPDARLGWYPFAVKACRELFSKERFDYILSFGPPHSTHLIAKKVSKEFNIPFVPVLIDPWVDIAYYKGHSRSRLTLLLDNYFERTTLTAAKHCVFVTEFMRKDYISKYPAIANKSSVIHWGFNEDMFEEIKPTKKSDDVLTLVHAGNIFDFQNPQRLWTALQSLLNKGKKIQIKFVGTVSPAIVKSIQESGLNEVTEYLGFLPYKAMLAVLTSADFLLVCPSEKRHVPGKLFEYLRIGRPILAIGDENQEVREIISNAGSGKFFTFADNPEEYLLSNPDFKREIMYINSFERKQLTAKLAANLGLK